MNTLPDVKLVADAVREIAKQYPDRIAPQLNYSPDEHDEGLNDGCFYVWPDEPTKGGCIVGQALIALGYVTDWNEVHPSHGIALNQTPIGDIYALDAADRNELWWLATVQERQDSGEPWGKAVALADEITAVA